MACLGPRRRSMSLLVSILLWPVLAFSQQDRTFAQSPRKLQEENPQKIALADSVENVQQQFEKAYLLGDEPPRQVIEQYLGSLGAEQIFEFLEATYPVCYDKAHDLGRAIFAQTGEMGPSLRLCGDRCRSGCTHGVLREAFGRRPLEEIEPQIVSFCNADQVRSRNKLGSCVQGIGHALMVASQYSLERALAACSTTPTPALAYFCPTGVFMESFTSGKYEDEAAEIQADQSEARHFPCDTHTRFPAACYRYKAIRILRHFNQETEKLVDECLALPRARRLGCFHGVGLSHTGYVHHDPTMLADICRYGTEEGQSLRIEGAIEKLADLDEEKAHAACESLHGQAAALCHAAATEKMYRPDKPTMALYVGPWDSPASTE